MENIEELYQYFLKSNGVSTDTRTIQAGQIFFALSGPNFNGNEYAYQALEKSALIVVVDDPEFYNQDDMHYLVKDSLQTLQELARHHRNKLDCKVLAITGSNGKTTTKELTHAALSKKFNCFATLGNLNNHIGVPLTLLSLSKDIEIAIIEMGANHQGEINELCEIAEPDFGLITNIGKAHLEGFGGIEGVLRGKTELYRFLEKNSGRIFLNIDDEKLKSEAGKIDSHEFSSKGYKLASLKGETLSLIYADKTYSTKLVGDYNKDNLVAAIEIAKYFGVSPENIREAIADYDPYNNRSQRIEKEGHIFILDAYNANPSSMELSVRNFSEAPFENKVLIIGEMLELGEYSDEEHSNLIKIIQDIPELGEVYLIGKSFGEVDVPSNYRLFENVYELISWFKSNKTEKRFSFLIKGSRANKLEKFYHSFKSSI